MPYVAQQVTQSRFIDCVFPPLPHLERIFYADMPLGSKCQHTDAWEEVCFSLRVFTRILNPYHSFVQKAGSSHFTGKPFLRKGEVFHSGSHSFLVFSATLLLPFPRTGDGPWRGM